MNEYISVMIENVKDSFYEYRNNAYKRLNLLEYLRMNYLTTYNAEKLLEGNEFKN